ncbi:uncharacterized protein AB675_5191 [Cyphellophora attinorum]|uniref:ATP adenylyltransferase C-terminal domain-containing protein n=1 Tax=Cyphellophora attinorum TaxID=1664694 RepID=A0A0N1H3H6_9EURO|nr:uncharacterized protein AB675_5191 [Phialophora attinorum]KPI39455.1 hypothetical protein AB675_5191 [Phialophora attinorum]
MAEPDGKSDLPHNVLLTKDWVCLIPRQHSRIDHSMITNAMGMVGVFWITHPSQIEDYTNIWGPLDEHMATIGYPSSHLALKAPPPMHPVA